MIIVPPLRCCECEIVKDEMVDINWSDKVKLDKEGTRILTSNEPIYPLRVLDSHESLRHATIRPNETLRPFTVKLYV